jgi:hypothetical protein
MHLIKKRQHNALFSSEENVMNDNIRIILLSDFDFMLSLKYLLKYDLNKLKYQVNSELTRIF